MDLDARIDLTLRAWARLCARRPKSILCLAAIFLLISLQGLSTLRIEAWTEHQLKATDPARLAMDKFRSEFGNEDVLLFLIRSDDLFSQSFLTRLQEFHQDIERSLPFVNDITSLLNVRFVYGADDTLYVEDLISDWPIGDVQLREIEQRARANPLYRNSMISDDGRHTAVVVELAADLSATPDADPARPLTNEEGEKLVGAAEALIERHHDESFPIWPAGRQPATIAILRALQADMTTFAAVSIVLVGTLLAMLFRRVSGVVLPLLSVGLTLVTTFGLMGLLHIPISPATQILPSFLIVVTVANAVHLLTILYRQLGIGRSQEDALADALAHTGVAIFMTSLTTAACLASFMFADLAILTGFGLQTAMGVLVAFGYTFMLLPPLLGSLPMRVINQARIPRPSQPGEHLLAWLARTTTAYPNTVVLCWVLIIVVSLAGAVQLQIEHKPIEWLDEEHPLRVAAEKVGETIHSTLSYEIIADSGKEEGLYDPEALRRLDAMRAYIENVQVGDLRAARAISLVDILKETHQALNGNEPDFFAVPDDRQLIAQELLLFEMSGADDIDDLTDKGYRLARMTVPVPIADGFIQRDYVELLQAGLPEISGDVLDVTVTGQATLDATVSAAMITSMVKSYFIALALLTPLMCLLTRDVRIGLISIVPNLAPVIVALGVMYWFGLRFDMFTILIGSMAIGIAVDDTIHILYGVKREYSRSGDSEQAIHRVMITTGKALLFTSIALAIGFVVFAAGSMTPIVHFGIITATTIVIAFAADVTLSPALISLVMRKRKNDLDRELDHGSGQTDHPASRTDDAAA